MKECKDIFEGYREAIRVEYGLKWSRIRASKSLEGKPHKLAEKHVAEPIGPPN